MIGVFSGLLIATDFGSIMNDLHLAQRYDDVTQLFLSDQYPWPSNKFFFGYFPSLYSSSSFRYPAFIRNDADLKESETPCKRSRTTSE